MILAALVLSCCLNAPLEVTVNADTLSVGAILPLPPADPRAAIALGYAPNPGVARRVGRQEILSKIQTAGMSVEDLQLPDSILVRRQAGALDAEQVRQAVLDAFVRQFPGANIEIVSVDTPAVQISPDSVSITATLPARSIRIRLCLFGWTCEAAPSRKRSSLGRWCGLRPFSPFSEIALPQTRKFAQRMWSGNPLRLWVLVRFPVRSMNFAACLLNATSRPARA